MPNESAAAVRPTRRCLSDHGLPIPDLGVVLSRLEHPLITKAQRVPDEARLGSAEVIKSLTDRQWYKVKVGAHRGAAGAVEGELAGEQGAVMAQLDAWWWLVAAGERKDDSPQDDFYARLERECHAAGPHSCSTDHLLPTAWDLNRLLGEAGVLAQRVVQEAVREAARQSLRTSAICGFTVGEADVRVRIRLEEEGEVYIAIGATAIVDPGFFTLLFSSLPSVAPGDWLPEPGGALGIEPAQGEILWSALLTTEAQHMLMGGA